MKRSACSKYFSLVCRAGFGGQPPALLTSTSMRPNSRMVSATRCSSCARSLTSQGTARARRPSPRTRSAVASISPCERALQTTLAPHSAKPGRSPGRCRVRRRSPVPPCRRDGSDRGSCALLDGPSSAGPGTYRPAVRVAQEGALPRPSVAAKKLSMLNSERAQIIGLRERAGATSSTESSLPGGPCSPAMASTRPRRARSRGRPGSARARCSSISRRSATCCCVCSRRTSSPCIAPRSPLSTPGTPLLDALAERLQQPLRLLRARRAPGARLPLRAGLPRSGASRRADDASRSTSCARSPTCSPARRSAV